MTGWNALRSHQKSFLLVIAVSISMGVFYSIMYQINSGMAQVSEVSHINLRSKRRSISARDKASYKELSNQGDKFTAVILLTYMRSGSSVTGDILQQNPDVFYVFEPLKNAGRNSMRNMSISFLNGTVLQSGQYDKFHIYKEALRGWLTCDFDRVYVESISDVFFLSLSQTTKVFVECIRAAGSRYRSWFQQWPEKRIESKIFLKCLLVLQTKCLASKYRVIKTIRARTEDAWSVMKDIEGSKLLHLIRDPRATMYSKKKQGVCSKQGGLLGCTENYCQRVHEDSVLQIKLETKHTGRFQTILYEDVATKPIETSKLMYTFLNMPFTARMTEYVYNITLGGNTSECKVCKVGWQGGKTNKTSVQRVESWKTGLQAKYINAIQTLCAFSMELYGYEQFSFVNLN